LAATHQRQRIYEALVSRPGHYSPEEVYDKVKRNLPSISLATVYKNLKSFVQAGMLRDVSHHQGPWRVDGNTVPHHHLVCTRCHSITDLDLDRLEPVKLNGRLPAGFHIEKFNVEVQGVCKACSAAVSKKQ
jgi:Fur family peroxide stress response transcriptional regulator